jgi:hypothetical protein
MSRIFLGHSSIDNIAAIALRDRLRAEGWGELFLYLDPTRGIAGGERFAFELAESCEDAEHQTSIGGRRIHLPTSPASTFKPTPRVRRSLAVFARWRRSRPRRSSFQSTRVLPGWIAFKQAISPGRSSGRPDAMSSTMQLGSTPAANIASRWSASVWVPSDFETRT